MKKHFILRTSVIALALIILMQVSAFAYNITLNLSTDKSTYDVDKEITLTVKWGEKQQAVGFTINYDASKVKFVGSSDIAETFYNSSTAGKILVTWMSTDEKDYTQMTFKFKTVAEGKAEFTITDADKANFSTGAIVSPETIDISKAKASVTIAKPTQEITGEKNESGMGIGIEETTTKKDNTVAGGKMPQTGAEITILFVIAVIAFIGIVGLKKYKNLSDI